MSSPSYTSGPPFSPDAFWMECQHGSFWANAVFIDGAYHPIITTADEPLRDSTCIPHFIGPPGTPFLLLPEPSVNLAVLALLVVLLFLAKRRSHRA